MAEILSIRRKTPSNQSKRKALNDTAQGMKLEKCTVVKNTNIGLITPIPLFYRDLKRCKQDKCKQRSHNMISEYFSIVHSYDIEIIVNSIKTVFIAKKKRYPVYRRNIYEILYNHLLTEKNLLPSIESFSVTGHFYRFSVSVVMVLQQIL